MLDLFHCCSPPLWNRPWGTLPHDHYCSTRMTSKFYCFLISHYWETMLTHENAVDSHLGPTRYDQKAWSTAKRRTQSWRIDE
jgi:hypothetical protein